MAIYESQFLESLSNSIYTFITITIMTYFNNKFEL